MRKKWAGYALACLLCLGLLAPVGQVHAMDTSVKVTLPDFAVNLNGHLAENQYREYPLLVYRGITYFPMTWNDARLLGLETNWSPETGLNIKQSQVTAAYAPNKPGSRNAAAYTAQIAASAITINGKAINNAQEPYPLLTFRNMTYFPLTWRFAHDEFGWDYRWDAVGGLRITSHNPQLQTVELPAYAAGNDVALFKGYYYFAETRGTQNYLYRAPVTQPSAKEEIYSYNYGNLDGPDTRLTFQIRDDTLWFTYHVGGGIMGSDRFVRISSDGTAELIHDGYLDFCDTPYGTLVVHFNAWAFEGDNLFLTPPGQEDAQGTKVGDVHLMYAVTSSGNGWRLGPVDVSSYLAVNGDDVYVIASRSDSDANHIYKINLKTNKTEKVADTGVSRFKLLDGKLVYVKFDDNALYASALDGTGETKLSDHAVSWFDSIDGNVFYTKKKNATQFELYKADENGEDPLVWASPVTGVQVMNGMLICQLGGSDGVVLLDGSGSLLVKAAEPVSHVLTSDDGILLQNANNVFSRLQESGKH